jgi:tetratricopeptide (TPR) repeat protein
MAEGGGIEGVPGTENEPRETEASAASAEALALALAMDSARHDPELSRKASEYLGRQRSLVDLQIKHFDRERCLAIEAAERKRYADRIRNGLTTFVALAVTVAVVGLGVMVWDAAHETGLVVEPFTVPPDLAQQGLTGQVVAKQVLDRLSELQLQTVSDRPANAYRNNWGDDLKVEIPETGISLGELSNYLRASLGHETRISGEVYRTPAGLTVAARSGEAAGKRLTGSDADVESLIEKAAEAVYEQTQPYRYGLYLASAERQKEALDVVTPLAHSADRLDRAWAHTAIGDIRVRLGDEPGVGVQEQRASLAEIPGFAPALTDLVWAEMLSGHDQAQFDAANEFLAANHSRRQYIAASRQNDDVANVSYWRARAQGDYAEATRQARLILGSMVTVPGDVYEIEAAALVLNHDVTAARASALRLPSGNPGRSLVLGLAAMEVGDATATRLLSGTAPSAFSAVVVSPAALQRAVTPWTALANARFGDLPGAQTLIATTPSDCYLCVRGRAQIAALAGDRAGAERWFAEAIKQGPSLPQAYADRGIARLTWGDLQGALTDAEQAAKLSPHHADAWKLWGDVLARQDQWKSALDKYEQALKYAPNWKQLNEAREAAAKQKP